MLFNGVPLPFHPNPGTPCQYNVLRTLPIEKFKIRAIHIAKVTGGFKISDMVHHPARMLDFVHGRFTFR